jgi:hypothetical protein
MSTTVSADVAYVLKHLDEVCGDKHKRKQDFHVQYNEDESLDGTDRFTKEETQSEPKVEVENVDDRTYRTLVRNFNYSFFLNNH